MRKFISRAAVMASVLTVFVGLSVASVAALEPGLQNVRLVGRFLDIRQQAAFEWPGSAMELEFQGRWLDVVLADTGRNSLVVDIDGGLSRLDLKKGEHTYRIFATEKASRHTVRLIRRTEALFGTTVLKTVKTDGELVPPRSKNRSLLVIGDSISAGYGVEGKNTKCKFSADTENQYLTFAAVAARRFEADAITLAISGKGLVRNNGGGTKATMNDLFDRVLPSRPIQEPLPKTDVIIVHLGTNDFGGGGRPGDFAERYTELLARLRANAPDAMIYAGIGPLLWDADLEAAVSEVDKAVAARRAAGDSKIALIQFTDPPGGLLRGCDWHPNEAGQRLMADQLESRIRADLGWAGTQ